MRKAVIAALAAGAMSIFGTSGAAAMPLSVETIKAAAAESLLEQVYHWGRPHGRRYHITRTSRWYWVARNLGPRACHIRYNSRFYAGRCRRW